MVEIRKNPPPDAVRQAAQHVLFVEGQLDSIDHEAMQTFLGDLVQVAPLGSSFHLASAAEALHQFHQTYYFLIDRDHHDDEFVAKCWARFPDKETRNLLVWRRRELENYFIIPEYLVQSQYITVDETKLRATIRDECQKRLYLDAVNQVITECRETLKKKWIEHFTDRFASRDDALTALREHPHFETKRTSFAACSHPDALAERFLALVQEWTGGHETLAYDHGTWLARLRGKEVFPTVAARCFKLVSTEKRTLQGPQMQRELAKSLLRRPLAEQPQDLQDLRRLIETRVRGA